jgi:hypothetical protein
MFQSFWEPGIRIVAVRLSIASVASSPIGDRGWTFCRLTCQANGPSQLHAMQSLRAMDPNRRLSMAL